MLIILTSLVLSAWFAWEAAGWLGEYLHDEMLYKLLDDHCQEAAFLETITNVDPWNTPMFNLSRPYLEDMLFTYYSTATGPTFHPMWLCDCGVNHHEGVPSCPVCGVIQPPF